MIFEFIRMHQLNTLLSLGTACMTLAILLLITGFLPGKRRLILIAMELAAALLALFDRLAYIHTGDISDMGFLTVRIADFMVFFLTAVIVLIFNLYLTDVLCGSDKKKTVPLELKIAGGGAVAGLVLVVISQFTGLYYTIDEQNIYHRSPLFIISYIVPVICPLIQYVAIRKNKDSISRLIYISLQIYIFVPVIAGIIQIFTYGLSIVNMAMTTVSILLYGFIHLDINSEVKKAHEIEVANLNNVKESKKQLFVQTARVFANAVEKRNDYLKGRADRVADIAGRIARMSGMDETECEKTYYAALLSEVGKLGIPDELLGKEDDLSDEEYEKIKEIPGISAELLEGIREYPFLSESVKYCRERYDGTGYPYGLKGDSIPVISRIIAVADDFVTMISPNESREAIPFQNVRESFVEGSGNKYDPEYAGYIIKIIDSGSEERDEDVTQVETELDCNKYRDAITVGIPIEEEVKCIRFKARPDRDRSEEFSGPSIILFDAYDRHAHSEQRAIEAFRYLEYGEIWFDGNYVATAARNMEVNPVALSDEEAFDVNDKEEKNASYEIIAAKYEDHVKLMINNGRQQYEVIAALPDKTKSVYLGLTGENCKIRGIAIEKSGEKAGEGYIKRISDGISYIDRMESDIPNVQIDRNRSAATKSLELTGRLKLTFHSLSLPTADLIWHCPYIVLYYSDDGNVFGEGYREYALIKINGESSGNEDYAVNKLSMKKTEAFPGWEAWKKINKEGLECRVELIRKGNKITTLTSNLGISIENITVINDDNKTVYAAVTGDQIALTDIRVG